VTIVHLVGFIIKKSHIFVDTNGRKADIQVNFRIDKTAMEGEKQANNKQSYGCKKCRWNIQKRKKLKTDWSRSNINLAIRTYRGCGNIIPGILNAVNRLR
jgi:hypothetical protein